MTGPDTRRTGRRTGVVVLAAVTVLLLALPAVAAPQAEDPRDRAAIKVATIADDLNIGNVVPTWGAQIPKIVFDGEWYYVATLDGNGFTHPWNARIWKSQDGQEWEQVVEMSNHTVYQPPALVFDQYDRLHLHLPCYTDQECYPGVEPAPGGPLGVVYTIRLTFGERLDDGSIDFSTFEDDTIRTGETERYYMGVAVDETRRYIYSAYAVNGWDLRLNVEDTTTGTEVTHAIGSPPPGYAYLYPRIAPGKDGEVYLSFMRYVLGSPTSAHIDQALLWKSTDNGATFPDKVVLASEPNPDGADNWVDATDVTVGPDGEVHTIFFVRSEGESTVRYQRGMDGEQVDIGPFGNHSQIVANDDGLLVFSSEGRSLLVGTSADGESWNTTHYPIAGVDAALWPNMLRASSGSAMPRGAQGHEAQEMLMAARSPGAAVYDTLLRVRYLPHVASVTGD